MNGMKDVLSTKTVKRNEVLRHMQLDRRKKIYKAINDLTQVQLKT